MTGMSADGTDASRLLDATYSHGHQCKRTSSPVNLAIVVTSIAEKMLTKLILSVLPKTKTCDCTSSASFVQIMSLHCLAASCVDCNKCVQHGDKFRCDCNFRIETTEFSY